MELQAQDLERRVIRNRIILAAMVILVASLLLVARVVWLQLLQHERFVTASEANRLQTLPLAPARGQILDRNGVVLAENAPRLQLNVIPEESDDLERLVHEVGRMIALSEDEIRSFYRSLERRRRPRDPVILKDSLTEAEAARVAVETHLFPELTVDARPKRFYPFGALTAHSIGYVGRLSLDELERLDERAYRGTQVIGKLGVEKAYEEALLGAVGLERVETSARGQIMRSIDRIDPSPGADIALHLDIGLQATAYRQLVGRRGAIVALDPKTGGVLAMASAPTFDANLFTAGISSRAYQALQTDPSNPMFNRALRGQYPPGSTIKPMLGLAGLDKQVVRWEDRIADPGYYQLPGLSHRYRDWKRWGHGEVDLDKAVVESCDTYFYDMAVRMGIDELTEKMAPFGFGRRVGIDSVAELPGVLPGRAWKRRVLNEPWYTGETVIAGIGQGYWLTTPLQLAVATIPLAQRGEFREARFRPETNPEPAQAVALAKARDWAKMVEVMESVMHEPNGTAYAAGRGLTYRLAGKTGTAQVFSLGQEEEYDPDAIEERLKDHALFVGFAPADNPTLVVAVVIENGGSGGSTAAPVARAIFDDWIVNRNQGQLPPDLRDVASVNQRLLDGEDANSR